MHASLFQFMTMLYCMTHVGAFTVPLKSSSSSSSSGSNSAARRTLQQQATSEDDAVPIDTTIHNGNSNIHRRTLLNSIPLILAATTATTQIPNLTAANAASPAVAPTDTKTLDKMAGKFKRVPLFVITNSENGRPFMILQNTGFANNYFFTSYLGAMAVLEDARRDAKDKGAETSQMWDMARITAVNMEFALKLAKARPKAMAQNDVKYDTVYDIIPTVKALDDATRLDKSGIFSERGRVPLFYTTEFEIGPEQPGEGNNNRLPVFLEKEDLLDQFAKKYPEKGTPSPGAVKVVDLVELFSAMMGSGVKGFEERLVSGDLYIVPSLESRKKAVDLEKERGTSTPAFKLGEMIAVGGK